MDVSKGSVTEKLSNLLKIASTKKADGRQKIQPKRKAAEESRNNPVVEDAIDDSDTDAHYKQEGEECSSSDDGSLPSNNELEPEQPKKSTRKSFFNITLNLEHFIRGEKKQRSCLQCSFIHQGGV